MKSAAFLDDLVVYMRAKAILEHVSIAVKMYRFCPLIHKTMVSSATRKPGIGCFSSFVMRFFSLLRRRLACVCAFFFGWKYRSYFLIVYCTFHDEMGVPYVVWYTTASF